MYEDVCAVVEAYWPSQRVAHWELRLLTRAGPKSRRRRWWFWERAGLEPASSKAWKILLMRFRSSLPETTSPSLLCCHPSPMAQSKLAALSSPSVTSSERSVHLQHMSTWSCERTNIIKIQSKSYNESAPAKCVSLFCGGRKSLMFNSGKQSATKSIRKARKCIVDLQRRTM